MAVAAPKSPWHVLSFGGGVNSAALLLLLLEEKQPLDEVLFADTGGELPETYAFIEEVKAFLDERAIPFNVLAYRIQGRDLYATCMKRRVIPSALWRWSTRDFKVKPIYRYYRSLGRPIIQYLAIAFDEVERMKDSREPGISSSFPLVDRRITRSKCIDIIQRSRLSVPPKSACFFCPFGTMDRWRMLHEEHPDLYAKAVALEENSKHFPKQRLTDQVFRERANVTLRELPAHFGGSSQGLTVVDDMAPCGPYCMT